ncbi:phage holin family protein [Verrucomicrobia bacterium]|nr:phage holin family protein [Verrucomicrobiota bacterium]
MQQDDPPAPQPSAKERNLALLRQWAATAAGVVVALNLVKGIHCDTLPALLLASFLLGVLNITFSGLKLFLGCLSLGLFAMVLNALLLRLVAWAVEPFHVDDFGSAFLGGIIISIVSIFVLMLSGSHGKNGKWRGANFQFNVRTNRSRPPGNPNRRNIGKDDDDDSGPVIDV